MSEPGSRDVSQLLEAITAGHHGAADELFPIVYDELKRMAHLRMRRERPGQTLQTTALVHEAYLRLLRGREVQWADRAHFFKAVSEAMRRILIERARARNRVKRGGGGRRLELDEAVASVEPPAEELLALDRALRRLEQKDELMSQVVKLRYFAGLTVDETSRTLGISMSSVDRLWAAARAWLRVEMDR